MPMDVLEWKANSVFFCRSASGTAPSILALRPAISGFNTAGLGKLGSRDEKSAILVGTGFPTHVLERAQPYMGMPGRTNVVVYLASNFVAYFNTWEVANA